jgi:hypothetical protein
MGNVLKCAYTVVPCGNGAGIQCRSENLVKSPMPTINLSLKGGCFNLKKKKQKRGSSKISKGKKNLRVSRKIHNAITFSCVVCVICVLLSYVFGQQVNVASLLMLIVSIYGLATR